MSDRVTREGAGAEERAMRRALELLSRLVEEAGGAIEADDADQVYVSMSTIEEAARYLKRRKR